MTCTVVSHTLTCCAVAVTRSHNHSVFHIETQSVVVIMSNGQFQTCVNIHVYAHTSVYAHMYTNTHTHTYTV